MSLINQVLKDIEKSDNQPPPLKLIPVSPEKNQLTLIKSIFIFVIIAISIFSYWILNSRSSAKINDNKITSTENLSGKNHPIEQQQSFEHQESKSHLASNKSMTEEAFGNKNTSISSNNELTNLAAENLQKSNKSKTTTDSSIAEKSHSLKIAQEINDKSQKQKKTESTLAKIDREKSKDNKRIETNFALKKDFQKDEQKTIKVVSSRTQLNIKLKSITDGLDTFGAEHSLKQLQALITENPDFHPARLQLIKLAWQHDRSLLRIALNDAVKQAPEQPAFFNAAARYYLEEGNAQAALDVLEDYRSIEKSAELLKVRALLNQKIGNHLSAIKDYQKVLSMVKDNNEAYLAMAISLEAVGETQNALVSYRRALSGNRLNQQQVQFIQNKLRSLQG